MDTTSIQLTAASSSFSWILLVFCFALLLSIPLLVRNFCSYILTIILSISAKLHPSSVITSNQLTAPSSSSTSNPPSRWDVFLSFRGKDTRRNFISHLYKTLDQAGILTFRDDPALEKGEQISPALLQAIKDSKKFVVVLSENYASSPWCLNELVEILNCKRINGQVVIPVYYYVNPSDVRYQKESFGEALDVHKNTKRYSDDMIKKWKSALAEIGELSGYHLSKDANENEADIIQKIVKVVVQPKVLYLGEYIFGIDTAVEAIHLQLRMESNDVRAILIWGMGGIGKTTTAKAFFNKYSNKFNVSCFIENVKQYSLLSLLEQLLIELLRKKDYKIPNLESGINELQRILPSKKALIVLDDLEQLELLVKLRNLFSPGSRIIVTARNASLQNKLKVDISEVDVYEVKGLGETESLELFSYHAFRKTVPPKSFKELSEGFVSYAGGLPLALKLLGSSLCGETEVSFWKAKLEIVVGTPETDIKTIFQQSYDGLDNEKQKAIFLDIAFFFVGHDKDEAVHIFNSCGFSPDNGIPTLVNRCLLTIDEDNKFQMHNLIQDVGRELGMSKGLFWRGNEWEDLQYLEGINKIEGLILDLSTSPESQMSAKIFKSMPKLRLLEIIGEEFAWQYIKGNFDNSFRELRCIRWFDCPWTSLPSDFRPRKLVSIDMPYNHFNTLWNDATPLVSLKTIDLSYSENLKTTPDFGDLKTVEKLLLRRCTNLLEVHPSIGQLTNLGDLDLSGCEHLELLPNSIQQLSNLGYLNMSRCPNLKRLPEQLGGMKGLKILKASDTAIEQLPDSIGHLKKLVKLKLNSCGKLNKLPEQLGDIEGLMKLDVSHTPIKQLPDSIAHLKELVELDLFGCWELNKLPELLGDMGGLRKLDASRTPIEQLPDSIGRLINLVYLNLGWCKNLTSLPNSICKLKWLKVLDLGYCYELERLPAQLGNMQCLEELDASATTIEELPDSIVLLSSLQELNLTRCWKLKKLPEQMGKMQGLKVLHLYSSAIEELPDSIGLLSSLQELDLYSCEKLKYLPDSIGLLSSLQKLDLYWCRKLEYLPDSIGIHSSLQELNLNGCLKLEYLPDSIGLLSSLQELILSSCRKLNKLPEQLGDMEGLREIDASHTLIEQLPDSIGRLINLVYLKLSDCKKLTTLPNSICKLKLLKLLDLGACSKLERLPEQLGKMQSLEKLKAYYTSIEELPVSIVLLSSLQELDLSMCWNLEYLPDSIGLLSRLRELNLSHCWKLEYLPDSIGLLSSLRELNLSHCEKLEYLPNSLRNLKSFQNYNIGNAKFKEI